MARNVGQVDAWCFLITAICGELGIAAHGVSPAGKGAKVNAKIENHGRAEKVLVFKFKRKKQYRKTQGHRQGYTQVMVTGIQA